MAAGLVRITNLEVGTILSEFIGLENVGSTKSLRRFSRASVLGAIEEIVAGFQAGGGVVFTTLAQANAHLNYDAFTEASVLQDATPANNGVYQKLGAPGAGSWDRAGDLPNEFITLTVSGGTANAITATFSPQQPATPGGKLYFIVPTANNTGAVTINGIAVKSALDATLSADSLIAGSPALMMWSGAYYKLIVPLLADTTEIRDIRKVGEDTHDLVTDAMPSLFRFTQPVPGLIDLQSRPLLASGRVREPAPLISISGTTLVGTSGSGVSATLFDANGVTIDQASSAYPCPRILWSRSGLGAKTVASVINGAAIPDDPRILIIVPAYGQSLAQGLSSLHPVFMKSCGYPNILVPKTATATDEHLGIFRLANPDFSYHDTTAAEILGFAPFAASAVEGGAVAQTAIGPLCAFLSEHVEAELGWAPRFCALNMAVGSAGIFHLKSGSSTSSGMTPMVDILAAIQGIATQALARGWIPWVPFMLWNHGQGDSFTTTYYDDVVDHMITPMNAGIQAITGQAAAPKWFSTQPSAAFTPGCETFLGHQKLHVQNKMTVVNPSFAYAIQAPTYEGWAYDFTHFSATAQVKWASDLAQAVLKEVFGGGREAVLLPVSAARAGSQIDVTMSEAFALDSSRAADLYGVRYYENGGGQPATVSVAQLNSTTLRVTTASPGSASSANSFVDFGLPRTIAGSVVINDTAANYYHGVRAARTRAARISLIEQVQPIYALHSSIGIT